MLSRMAMSVFGFRLAPIFLSMVILAGCAAVVDPNSSPAQQRMAQASQRFSNTVAEGAIAGLILGAAVGALAGGGRGAAIGAGAGLATGAVAGYMVAQNNFQHSQSQQNLA